MLDNLLNSVIDFKNNNVTLPTYEDGAFSLVNRSVALVETLHSQFSSNLELRTDFTLTGFKPVVRYVDATADYTGINKKYIDETGFYDLHSAIEEFVRNYPGMRLSKQEIEAVAGSSPRHDSHVLYIYNMLVSWYKALLYRDTRGENGTFKVRRGGYSDSHVSYAVRGQLTEGFSEVTMGSPVEETDLGQYSVRTMTSFWDSPYVVRLRGTNPMALGFYMLHLNGRTQTSDLSVDFELPGLDDREAAIDLVGASSLTMLDADAIRWTSPETIWLWIKDYVELNRVETAFAQAMELLSALAFQPLPSYHESKVWEKCQINVTLAKFTPTRARVPGNLDGEQYLNSTDAKEFSLTDGSNPKGYLLHGAVANYLTWLGLGALVDNFASGLSDWRLAYLAASDEMSVVRSVNARAAIISFLLDKEVVTYMDGNVNVSYDTTAMADATQIVFDIVHDDTPRVKQLDGPYPYVSGSLVLGAVSTTLPALQHLVSHGTIMPSAYNDYTPQEAITMTNVYRLFGHDVQPYHVKTGEEYPTFATAHECVICPSAILNNARDFDRLALTESTARAGRTHFLPHSSSIRHRNTFTFTFTTPVLSLNRFGRRTLPCRPSIRVASRRQEIRFTVKSSGTLQHVKIAGGGTGRVVRQGFRDVPIRTVPEQPLPSGTGTSVPILPDSLETDDVDTAE
nr:coat protein [Umbelopsis gibberispora virus 1]